MDWTWWDRSGAYIRMERLIVPWFSVEMLASVMPAKVTEVSVTMRQVGLSVVG